jgi:hypothetical protein
MCLFPLVRASFEAHVETLWACTNTHTNVTRTHTHSNTHTFPMYYSDIQVYGCFYSKLFWNVVAHFVDLTSHNFVTTLVEIIMGV